MTAPDPRLDAIKERVAEAEEKRARCRANPDPIFSAGMMLAIQASSADVPHLLSVVEAQAGQITKVRELHRPITHHFLTPPAGSLEVCHACRESYPCTTITALAPEGPEA